MVGITTSGKKVQRQRLVEAWVPQNFSILTCDSHWPSPSETRYPGKHKSPKSTGTVARMEQRDTFWVMERAE